MKANLQPPPLSGPTRARQHKPPLIGRFTQFGLTVIGLLLLISLCGHLGTAEGRRLAMVQQFLPAVRKGDKRVLLLDGELLGAINRVPREDDIRSNIHVGGRVEPVEVTERERAVIADLAPPLRADGLVFVGLDFIGERLTEVNVTSPTGIQELSQHRGRDVAADVIAWVERKAEELSPRPSGSIAP